MPSGPIPIGDARRISRERNCPMVVVFAIEAGGERFAVTTYGATKKLCKLAATYGDLIADGILHGKIVEAVQAEPDGPEKPATKAFRVEDPDA